ncbi:MAG: hypothetical protein H0X34_18985 [Chthoniobacterales bacterium]|nr:hypothetical protein [Chthoniobacterales bacterium]
MKNDITRDTFDRVKQFSRVLMQQGRVQLDADWNEQVSILLHYLRVLTTDMIGPGAGPEDACGFELFDSDADIKALKLGADKEEELIARLKEEKVLIAPGRYYVNGILAEIDDFASIPQPSTQLAFEAAAASGLTNKQAVLIYLDVWERHVTPIEDDGIREKALGGPDTATRARITWVVRARELRKEEDAMVKLPATTKAELAKLRDLHSKFDAWREAQWTSRGLLRAGIEEQVESGDPCVNSPESVYRGMENQLYRVEIHRRGPAWDGETKAAMSNAATFKWSRDNGSVAAAWLDGEGEILKVTASRDEARGFAPGQWIELSDDRQDLESVPGTLVQLKETEAGSLTIDQATTKGIFARKNFGNKAKVRRWDQEETEVITLDEGAITIQYDKWFALEDGVQIQFPAPAAPATYKFHSGDYWLIPARVVSRDIEWAWEEASEKTTTPTIAQRRALPPHGIKHHYALLGLLAAAAGGAFEFTDLRRKIRAVSE